MRLRSALVTTAFAAATLLGGAASASADDSDHEVFGEGGYSQESAGFYYKNLGGPAGITHLGGSKHGSEGWLRFLGY